MSSDLFSTKQRILGAAETLFAQHGFAGASLRQVTAAANVNLAAVNYHFGSKENLINEVLRRRLEELNNQRLQALRAALGSPDCKLEDVLDALIRPALELSGAEQNGGTAFVRLIARAYAEHNEQLRKFLHDHNSHVFKEFTVALAQQLPHLDKQELYWRLDIIGGALTFAMADFGLIKRRGPIEQHRDLTADHLIKFAAAGLRA